MSFKEFQDGFLRTGMGQIRQIKILLPTKCLFNWTYGSGDCPLKNFKVALIRDPILCP